MVPLFMKGESPTPEATWREVDEDSFFRACIPFEMEGSTKVSGEFVLFWQRFENNW